MADVFLCGRGDGRPPCAYCGKKTDRTCIYQLAGKRAGKHCGTPVCERCSKGTGLCRPHRNQKLVTALDRDPGLVLAGEAGTHVVREEIDGEELED